MEKNIILSKKENPLFSRKEIYISVQRDITPRMNEAEEFVAKEFSVAPENVKIRKIKGQFGSKTFVISANIYSSKEEKEKTEAKSRKEKKEAAVKKEEKNKEEKKE